MIDITASAPRERDADRRSAVLDRGHAEADDHDEAAREADKRARPLQATGERHSDDRLDMFEPVALCGRAGTLALLAR